MPFDNLKKNKYLLGILVQRKSSDKRISSWPSAAAKSLSAVVSLSCHLPSSTAHRYSAMQLSDDRCRPPGLPCHIVPKARLKASHGSSMTLFGNPSHAMSAVWRSRTGESGAVCSHGSCLVP